MQCLLCLHTCMQCTCILHHTLAWIHSTLLWHSYTSDSKYSYLMPFALYCSFLENGCHLSEFAVQYHRCTYALTFDLYDFQLKPLNIMQCKLLEQLGQQPLSRKLSYSNFFCGLHKLLQLWSFTSYRSGGPSQATAVITSYQSFTSYFRSHEVLSLLSVPHPTMLRWNSWLGWLFWSERHEVKHDWRRGWVTRLSYEVLWRNFARYHVMQATTKPFRSRGSTEEHDQAKIHPRTN